MEKINRLGPPFKLLKIWASKQEQTLNKCRGTTKMKM